MKRYSMEVCAAYAKISPMAVWDRARRLGLETKNGLTAADLKAVLELGTRRRRRFSLEDLRAEMEALK